jgi:hypothetical protein
MRELFGHEDYLGTEWRTMISCKFQFTGPTFRWVGFGELLWGRLLVVIGGERLVGGVPLHYFAQQDIHNITDVCTCLKEMTRADIREAGGFYALLEAGQAMVTPPGYIMVDLNTGAIQNSPLDSADAPCDVMAP